MSETFYRFLPLDEAAALEGGSVAEIIKRYNKHELTAARTRPTGPMCIVAVEAVPGELRLVLGDDCPTVLIPSDAQGVASYIVPKL